MTRIEAIESINAKQNANNRFYNIGEAEIMEEINKEGDNKMDTATKIINWLKEHEDEYTELIEELDNYNGYLGDDRYYNMEDINEFYHDTEAEEVLRRAFYGHDADNWTIDSHGEKEYAAFNPNREYFYYNGYGNLVSSDYKDYSDKLDKWFIESCNENRENLYTIESNNELSELFDELEAE